MHAREEFGTKSERALGTEERKAVSGTGGKLIIINEPEKCIRKLKANA